jgi:hypothetical protein
MPVTVKNILLWRKEVENQVGSLAHTLEPVTKAGANLHVLMGYRYPGKGTKAAIELYPIAGKKVNAAASEAGLSASSIPTLLVEGDDKPGLGLAITQAIARAGINMTFFVAQSIGRRFSAVLGFETQADTKAAAPLIKGRGESKEVKGDDRITGWPSVYKCRRIKVRKASPGRLNRIHREDYPNAVCQSAPRRRFSGSNRPTHTNI